MNRFVRLLILVPTLLLAVPVQAFFDGVDPASRPVMREARERIERIRKGDSGRLIRHPMPNERPERVVADFLAGMTDRYALRLYRSIYLPKPWASWRA